MSIHMAMHMAIHTSADMSMCLFVAVVAMCYPFVLKRNPRVTATVTTMGACSPETSTATTAAVKTANGAVPTWNPDGGKTKVSRLGAGECKQQPVALVVPAATSTPLTSNGAVDACACASVRAGGRAGWLAGERSSIWCGMPAD